ncbi:acyl-CoA dehydrogenase family protein [Spirillospora sp. NPDC050679]
MPETGCGELHEPTTDEGRRLLGLVARRCELIAADAAANDRAGAFPVGVFDRLRRDGVLGATAPKELGGIGVASLHDVALALLTVAEHDASTALALHMQLSRGLTFSYEWRYGDETARALAERLLRGMGSGEAVVCTAVKDSVVGGGGPTTLRPGPGGWVLSGRKMLASMAPIATHFVLSARVEAPPGPVRTAAAVVPRDRAGVTVLDNWDGLGMRASGSVDVAVADCAVPEGDVFMRGPEGARDDAALAGQTVSSITMLGIYVGVAQAARRIAGDTLRRRGRAPGAAVRTLLAEIDARLYAARATVAASLRNAEAVSARLDLDPGERGRRMMVPFQQAKLVTNRLAPEVVGDCLTLVGGASYSGGHPLGRLYRDVRAGAFMHPYTYADAVDHLSDHALPAGGA